MNSHEKPNPIDLSHWDLIRNISLEQAAILMAGIDPAGYDEDCHEYTKALVYEQAISDAVQRANDYAWQHARLLDRLMLYSRKNAEKLNKLRGIADIWEASGSSHDYLPSIEIRNSVATVNSNPNKFAILKHVDPWYTASVYGSDLNKWFSKYKTLSSYTFKENQTIIVTDRESNWDSEQDIIEGKTKEFSPAPPDSAKKSPDEIKSEKAALSTRERNTLLSIIAALCNSAKIDYSRPAKSACVIKDLTVSMGVIVGESTIESHLKRIPDALAARIK